MAEQEIIELLNQYEWKDVEFKEAQNAVPKNVYETVSAFANTSGGHIVLGVKKNGSDFKIVGIVDVDKIQNDFLTTLRQKEKISSIIEVKESLQNTNGKNLLIFYIPEANRTSKPVYLNGDIKRSFLRKGACDVRCSDEELKRLLNDASRERYDGNTLDYDIKKCFNEKDIRWYRNQYESKIGNRRYVKLSDEDFLFQFGLIKETSSGIKPTIGSILLFGQDGYLRSILPRPVIDCQRYLYKSDTINNGRWHDRTVCDYNLVQTWLAVMEWYYRFAEIPFQVNPKTMQRKDQPVDYVAFREAIVNMLIHQDYSDHTRKPVIQHYSNLTRFWNPGDAFTSVHDLLEPGEKETRNPLIVTAFRRIGLSENAGWGLRDVFNTWRDLGHVPPELTNNKSIKTFELILKLDILSSDNQINLNPQSGIHLTEEEVAVFAYACKKQAHFTFDDIKTIINKSPKFCLTILDQLVNKNLLTQDSENHYEVAPTVKQIFLNEAQVEAQVNKHEAQVEAQVNKHEAQVELTTIEQKILLALMKSEKSGKQLIEIIGYKSRTGNFKRSLEKLLASEFIQMTNPDNPKASNQKYVITPKGTLTIKNMTI